jgi:hypothetical protein
VGKLAACRYDPCVEAGSCEKSLPGGGSITPVPGPVGPFDEEWSFPFELIPIIPSAVSVGHFVGRDAITQFAAWRFLDGICQCHAVLSCDQQEEFLAWLRRILLNDLANCARHYCETDKRQLSREVSLANTPRADLQNVIASEADSPRTQMLARWQLDAAERMRLRSGQRVNWLRNTDECSGAGCAQMSSRHSCVRLNRPSSVKTCQDAEAASKS